jgi:hypothetical protein
MVIDSCSLKKNKEIYFDKLLVEKEQYLKQNIQ